MEETERAKGRNAWVPGDCILERGELEVESQEDQDKSFYWNLICVKEDMPFYRRCGCLTVG